ncbi:MAG: N-acetyltransferase [Proteobacteria bacterium]|nr:MAG: N-acetyltransferase [Pseudomonadota bacterium]
MSSQFNVAALFEDFEPIETERLLLRPLRASDAEATFAILKDPEVMRYFGSPPFTSSDQAVARCERLILGFEDKSKFRLALELKESGQFIGTAGFWKFVPEHFRAEISYELSSSHWGKGLMVEALKPMLVRIFDRGLNSVEANIHPDNIASRRVLEKLGFQLEGVTRDSFYEPYLGVFTDNAIFGLTKSDFVQRNA